MLWQSFNNVCQSLLVCISWIYTSTVKFIHSVKSKLLIWFRIGLLYFNVIGLILILFSAANLNIPGLNIENCLFVIYPLGKINKLQFSFLNNSNTFNFTLDPLSLSPLL